MLIVCVTPYQIILLPIIVEALIKPIKSFCTSLNDYKFDHNSNGMEIGGIEIEIKISTAIKIYLSLCTNIDILQCLINP